MRSGSVFASCCVFMVASGLAAGNPEPEWTALCTGVSEGGGNTVLVNASVIFDDGSGEALYLGGRFRFAGVEAVNNIVRWDGLTFSPLAGLGTQSGPSVNALAVFDDGTGPALYAGGDFGSYEGVTYNNIAKWDGEVWTPLTGSGGTGLTGTSSAVSSLAVYDGALYVGGRFSAAGGVGASNIARWDGENWEAIGGTNLQVNALAVFDDGSGEALYVGGRFRAAGGVGLDRIARYDGASWTSVGGGIGGTTSAFVDALCVHDGGGGEALYVGGSFSRSGVVDAANIARWDGLGWSALGSGIVGGSVDSLVSHDDGMGRALFVGGDFDFAGGVAVNGIARWDGSWESVGSGISGGVVPSVRTLASFDDGGGWALYAGGTFLSVDGVSASRVARYGLPRVNEACPGDLNFDCSVNFSDLNGILSAFGEMGTPGTLPADINSDGIVNFADLNGALSGFGLPCD